ncbi:class II histone deacetylase [Tengunoibacter tsumagoiensis]|uniref:Histone deacetylase n=1 Tax=Tengunoibacter tsumagoiensis TaxID=2014871 RepID=A0A402A0R4_9CHLR|nr:class II histone deacetylase [Tengunoibacter tsumagoiensis]GCE12740.1 histone deacetylase [Tengunoibacter tsumagoiensis]
MSTQRSGLVFDERFLAHDTGSESRVQMRSGFFDLTPEPHPSSAVITRRIKEFLDGSGLTAQMLPIAAREAIDEELLPYHTREYLAGIREHCYGGPKEGPWGSIDEETVLNPGSYEAARYAVGGALNAVATVLQGQVRNAYALLRPPGHHALRNQAYGFCIFNNAVLAAQYARKQFGIERIMIVDWDVHHGNGIQDAFYADPDVLFVSLHQQNWFPRLSGELEQVGCGAGVGTTVNIPLPPGTGDRGYQAAFEQIVLPIGLQFRPQLILVSAGQDASWLDPLAQMMMTMDGYRRISALLVQLAEEVCEGRLVMVQEGGYSAPYVPYCTVAAVEPLLGADLGIVDLYATAPELELCQSIFSDETQRALQTIRNWQRQWWKL